MKYTRLLNMTKLVFLPFLFCVNCQAESLKVGLYPYVPRLEQFQIALKEQWNKVQPDVALEFDDKWDGGYDMNPPDDIDVFVFDAMLFESFLAGGYLEAINEKEIDDLDDFVDYAIDGVQSNGQYYAIPQLGCANILFYKKSDAALAKAKSLEDINQALDQCTYTSQIPPDRRGLMMDMQGGTTNAAYYLDIAYSLNGKYPFPLPPTEKDLNQNVIDDMNELLSIASYDNATESPPKSYGRATWLSKGYGRAMVGFTEHMSAMSADIRSQISFKPLQAYDTPYPPIFYSDVIGVNPNVVKNGKRKLAIQLANVMASEETMIASIGSDSTHSYPQYLMAARPNVFKQLGKTFPIYNDMYSMLLESKPIMFKLSSDARTWLPDMKNTIRSAARSDYKCGCDQVTETLISGNSQAEGICLDTCKDYGGWNGQWTNMAPAAPTGKSVCGCKVCTIQ